jgi:hypothetical protein
MATTTTQRNTYGTYKPKTTYQQTREQDLKWYNDATNRLKNRGFQQGSDQWNNNAQRIYDIGNKWGLNWKEHLGANYAPGSTTPNTMNTIQAPAGLRPENAPLFNLLNNDERRKFINMRNSNPRQALQWMQQTTQGRQAAQTQQPAQTDQTGQPAQTDQQPAADPAATPPDSVSTFDFASYRSPMTDALMKAMSEGMSTMQAYEPKFFEGSPLYQFQKEKGMKDLEKLMAARGLTGSGAEIQGNSDFLAQINATEAEKQRGYAEANRDRQNQMMQFIANFDSQEREALRDQWNKDLDQRTNMSQFEANRGDARQAMTVNFLSNLLNMQSQNDIARLSQGGMGSQTDLTKALLQAMTNNTMAQVPRGGGGGGGGAPPPQPSNNSALMGLLMNYGNRAGNNDFLNGILNLFSGK